MAWTASSKIVVWKERNTVKQMSIKYNLDTREVCRQLNEGVDVEDIFTMERIRHYMDNFFSNKECPYQLSDEEIEHRHNVNQLKIFMRKQGWCI